MIRIMKKEEFKALQNFEGEYWYISDRVCDIYSDMEEGYEDDFVEPSNFELKKWALEDIVNTFKDDINNGHYDEAIIVDDYPVEGSIIVGLELVKVQQDKPINEREEKHMEKLKNEKFGGINELNSSILSGDTLDIVSVKEFRELHKNATGFDRLVASIVSVDRIKDGYRIHFSNGHSVSARYDGYIKKDSTKWNQNIDNKNGHIRVNNVSGKNSSLFIEKIIGLARIWLDNELPSSFRGLVVNVKDGSSNINKTVERGLVPSFYEENLEWTTSDRNSIHGSYLRTIYNNLHSVYRMSANDQYLIDHWSMWNWSQKKEYLDEMFIKVK